MEGGGERELLEQPHEMDGKGPSGVTSSPRLPMDMALQGHG